MRDLSKNIRAAKEAVIPDVPDLICHYHFPENVGKKLCDKPHTKLTKDLRRLRTRAALATLRKEMVRWSRRGNTLLTQQRIEELLSQPERAVDLELVSLPHPVAYLLLRWLDDFGSCAIRCKHSVGGRPFQAVIHAFEKDDMESRCW